MSLLYCYALVCIVLSCRAFVSVLLFRVLLSVLCCGVVFWIVFSCIVCVLLCCVVLYVLCCMVGVPFCCLCCVVLLYVLWCVVFCCVVLSALCCLC